MTRGGAGVKSGSPFTEAAAIAVRAGPDRKNSSSPRGDQRGHAPPSVETCQRRPPSGHGCTYTSYRPDSLEWYATQRPSGEIAGTDSANGVRRKGRTFTG